MFQSPRAALTRQGLARPSSIRATSRAWNGLFQKRQLLTLAIETSCDDTSVAVLEKRDAPSSSSSSSSSSSASSPISSSPSSSSSSGSGRSAPTGSATLHFLESASASSAENRGIHPIVALEGHQMRLAKLVDKALRHLPKTRENDSAKAITPAAGAGGGVGIGEASGARMEVARRKPDFISVTRGPGMRSCLLTGLDTAKGLAVAWQVPVVGVHHMQAHLLTPRLVSALERRSSSTTEYGLQFPLVSLLVSGGHSLLAHSKSFVDHTVLSDTVDTAIGHIIDKAAKLILPPSYIEQSNNSMYGRALEAFAFPNGASDFANYKAPTSRQSELQPKENEKWGWRYQLPFAESREASFSFSGILSETQRFIDGKRSEWKDTMKQSEEGSSEVDPEAFLPRAARVALAKDFMTACFEHLASRTVIALEDLWVEDRMKRYPKNYKNKKAERDHARSMRERRMQLVRQGKVSGSLDPGITKTLVVSGGVASNNLLLRILRSFLDERGFGDIEIVAPPPTLCTDNAAMIGWTGIEMYEAGWRSDLGIRPVREWSLDHNVQNGGIFGQDGWIKDEE